MLPCKKILCAIDFSEASFDALKAANELALCFSSELLLVHVRPLVCWPADVLATRGFDAGSSEQQLHESARRDIEEVAATRVPPNIERRIILRVGDAGHEILETAKS